MNFAVCDHQTHDLVKTYRCRRVGQHCKGDITISDDLCRGLAQPASTYLSKLPSERSLKDCKEKDLKASKIAS
jgi:hypothetical protein